MYLLSSCLCMRQPVCWCISYTHTITYQACTHTHTHTTHTHTHTQSHAQMDTCVLDRVHMHACAFTNYYALTVCCILSITFEDSILLFIVGVGMVFFFFSCDMQEYSATAVHSSHCADNMCVCNHKMYLI